MFGRASRKNHIRDGQTLVAWLMSLPSLIVMFAFLILPFIMAFGYSFTNKMLISNNRNPLKLVGFDNYTRLFANSITYKAFFNTLEYTVIIVPLITIISLLLALLVNKPMKGIGSFRTIYFAPQVLSMTVVAVAWAFILSSSSDGLLNSFIKLFGIHPQTWLKDPRLAMPVIILMTLWQVVGLQMIIYLSGIQYIPTELYEASEIDGCTPWQKFSKITLPLLKNTTMFIIVSNTIFSLRLFTQPFVLTKGGPQNSTISLVYQIYTAGFTNMQIGYSSALAVVFFLMVLIVSVFQMKLMSGEKA